MNAHASGPPPALATLRQQAGVWWLGRTPRERQAVTLMAVFAALLLVWSVLVQPALSTLRAAPGQIDTLNAQLEQMRSVADESRGLRGAPVVSVAQAAAALKTASDRLGPKAKLTLQGDRATLALNAVDADSLRNWLLEARSAARARPVEAQLQRNGIGYTGTLVVSLGAGT